MPKTKDLFVDQGATFDKFYIHVPICNPSRSTTLTGRYLHNIKGVDTKWAAMHVDMNNVHNRSFAVRLKRLGYTVGLFGKYLNAIPGTNVSKSGAYVPEGFDAWMANGGGTYVAPEFATYGLEEASGIPDGAIRYDDDPSNYSTSVIGNTSIGWIRHVVRSNPEQPFFAYIAPKAAHEPFLPPIWYRDTWFDHWPETEPRPINWNCSYASRAHHAGVVATNSMITEEAAEVITGTFKNRWRSLLAVDDLIADVVDVIERELGLADTTHFFYSSDHGFQLGNFNVLMDKRHVYEWNTRIHLVVRSPLVTSAVRIPYPATNVDLAPTFVHLAEGSSSCDETTGVCAGGSDSSDPNTNAPFDGRSLVPLLTNTVNDDAWRRDVFIEYYYNDPNVKCVTNCQTTGREYPRADAQCAELDTLPNNLCWSPVCNQTCYPTENAMNNFIAIRRFDDDLLYAEYAIGNQSKADINFSKPDFYEVFNATRDVWMMDNLWPLDDSNLSKKLHMELHSWFHCKGITCP